MATVITTTYSSDTTITLDLGLTPLASSASLTAGRESTEIDNTTNQYIDAIVHGFVTTGTSPTAGNIMIYVWGNYQTLASVNLAGVLDGTDSDETIADVERRDSTLRLARAIPTNTTNDIAYDIAPFSVAQLFGGVMPKFWGLFVTHDTGVALNTTSVNHVFKFNGITYTST